MRISESVLRRYVRQILQEKVFGAQAFVYHGSKLAPEQFIETVETNSFKPGSGAGAMYGKGLYTVYDEDTGSNTFRGYYGRYVYKLKVNLSGFMIFDPGVCVKVHGKKISLKDQMFQIGLKSEYAALKNAWEKGDWSSRLESSVENPTFEDIFESEDLRDVTSDFTSQVALQASTILRNKCAGLVFTGETDGSVCVIYDPSGVVVLGYQDTDNIDDPEKFEYIRLGREQVRRAGTVTPDPGRYMPSHRIGVKALYTTLEKSGIQFDRSKMPKVNEWMSVDNTIGGSEWGWPKHVRELLVLCNERNAFTPILTRDEINKLTSDAWALAKEMMSKETAP